MAGMGLIHLGFLAAAAAVAVPLVIHLLLRPRARRVEIGSVRFLKQVMRDSTRSRRLRRWLLLLLRAAALLLLALLFARPYLRGTGTEGKDREVIVLVDQSASMRATGPGGTTLFTQAQEAADKLLRQLPEQTAVQVAYFDSRGVTADDNVRINLGRLPGYAGTDYGLALRWARDLIVLSPRPRRQVYLFTDLQRCGLRGTPFEGFPPDVALEIVEVGSPLLMNLTVESVEAMHTTLRPNEPLVVTASVFNAGRFPASSVPVQLSLEGPGPKVQQVQTLTLAPGSRQVVRFSPPIDKPGLYYGFVEVGGDDAFPLDNRRWLAFDARPPDRLLVVDGRPGSTVYTNSTYYLEAALRLALPDQGTPLTPYQPERLAWAEGAALPELKPFRAVVLSNVAALAEKDAGRLRDYVAEGGGLLLFTGPQVNPAGYEPLWRAGLLAVSVEGVSGPDEVHFDTWDKGHPIFVPLSDPQQGDLRRVVFRHITRMNCAEGVKVLAATEAGNPLMVESRLGAGTVLVFASTADLTWGDWPKGRLFLPLVHQIVGYLTERLPENQRVRSAPTGPGAEGPPGVERDGHAVIVRNLDPAESEIDRLSGEEFRRQFHVPVVEGEAYKEQSAAEAAALAGGQRADEVWVYVVLVLLVVLLAELWVANRTDG
jgi:hypothetical protein